MSLAADLEAIPDSHRTRGCAFGAWLDSLDPADAALVWAAVMSKKPQRAVAAVISRNGHTVSQSTIGGHRHGECVTCRSRTI